MQGYRPGAMHQDLQVLHVKQAALTLSARAEFAVCYAEIQSWRYAPGLLEVAWSAALTLSARAESAVRYAELQSWRYAPVFLDVGVLP